MLRLSREIADEEDTEKGVKKRYRYTATDRGGIYRQNERKPWRRQKKIKNVNEKQSWLELET